MVYAIEGLGQEYKEKISDEDKETINKLVADGKAMKDREDVTVQEVKDETDRLQRESQPLFQKYAQTAQQNADANG
jgi:molecular chaperone DnaK (HSP70)